MIANLLLRGGLVVVAVCVSILTVVLTVSIFWFVPAMLLPLLIIVFPAIMFLALKYGIFYQEILPLEYFHSVGAKSKAKRKLKAKYHDNLPY